MSTRSRELYKWKFIWKYIGAFVLTILCIIGPARAVKAYDDIVVVIDPGHGGVVTDTNSNGGCIYNGVMEKDVNLITAQALYNELSQYQNVTVYMTRTTDVEMSIDERIAFAKSVYANVFVSVHYNASNDHNFYGSEIFTSMYGQPYATGTCLGRCIMKNWESFGNVSKGIKTRKGNNGDYYGLIRKGCDLGMPVIILEHGYLDNDKDFTRLNSIEAWQKLGVLDATGIADYYGFKKDVVQEKITPTVAMGAPTTEMTPDETAPTSVKLSVDEYDPETGIMKYSISASETQSMLMYYGFETGKITEETVFDNLILWDNDKGVQTGEYDVGKGFEGDITARVYNNYELFTDSEKMTIAAKEPDEDTDKNDAEEENDAANEIDDEELDNVPSDKGNGETKIIDEIIIGQQAEYIDITPEMVEKAEAARSQKTKAIMGIAIAGSVVALAILIAVTIAVVNSGNRRAAKRKSDDYDWNRRRNR